MATIKLSKQQWQFVGEQTGWIKAEAKKKGKPVNPWAVCNKSTGGKKKDPEKFERCVMDVKAKHPIKKD